VRVSGAAGWKLELNMSAAAWERCAGEEKERVSPCMHRTKARDVGRCGSEFMTPTGKSGFRKKNAVETRMIAGYAFNHARQPIFLPKAD